MRGRAEGRFLARLPPGSPLPREDAVYQFITMVANGYLADGVARQPRPYTINITGFSSARLTSAM